MITPNGIIDSTQGQVLAPNTGTWADLTTWATWTAYTQTAPTYLYYLMDPVDLGDPKTFCLTINTVANGIVDYYIYTSNTGLFTGEETETVILSEADGIQGFTARFYQIGLRVEKISEPQVISGIEVRLSQQKNTLSIDNVDTTTLDGTIDAYEIPLPKVLGTITNVQITPKEVTAYNMDVYVTNTPTSKTVVPRIVSKNAATPTFALVGMDNHARDAVVDIKIEYLPEMYMDQNTLRVR